VVRPSAAVVLLLLLGVGCDRLSGCGPSAWKSPEVQVRDALAHLDRARLDPLPAGAAAELATVRYFEPAVSVERGRATVAAMVDAEGRVVREGEAIALRYLGRERFHLRSCGDGWCPEGDELARLRGVLAALLGRERRADEGRATAWQVRVERDRAEVGEDRVDASGRPSRRLLELAPEGERWTLRTAR
jgi:hypothetical protein